jgi:hypothetical protein
MLQAGEAGELSFTVSTRTAASMFRHTGSTGGAGRPI